MICEYCKHDFNNTSSFNKHLRTAKKCMILRNGDGGQPQQKTCTFCYKELSSKQRLNTHMEKCPYKDKPLQNVSVFGGMVTKLQKEVDTLKETLKESLKAPATITINQTNQTNNQTNNNQTNNNYGSILNLTQSALQESFKNYTLKDLLSTDNQKMLADMTIKKCLSGPDQPVYICKDRARHKFFYTDEENEEKEDPNAIVLRTLVYNGVKPILAKLYAEKIVALNAELARSRRIDSSDMMMNAHEDIKELKDAYAKINILKNSDDYIAQLSKCLPSSIKDRLYQDHLEQLCELNGDDFDDALEREIQRQTRMIGDYTAAELGKWKKMYRETGKMCGPKGFDTDMEFQQQLLEFYTAPF